MVGKCALFFLWSACSEDGATSGSIPEWLTLVVTVLALAAAVYAGLQASKAAKGAQKQAAVAVAAFRADAKVRAEASASKVYSVIFDHDFVEPSELALGIFADLDRTVLEPEVFSPDTHLFIVPALRVAFHISNDSDEVVGPISYQLVFRDGYRSVQRIDVRPLLPHTKTAFEIVTTWPTGMARGPDNPIELLGIVPEIELRDSAGRWWRRRGYDPIERLQRGATSLP